MSHKEGNEHCYIGIDNMAYKKQIILDLREDVGMISIDEDNLRRIMKMSLTRLKQCGYEPYLSILLDVHDDVDMPNHRLRSAVADLIRGDK